MPAIDRARIESTYATIRPHVRVTPVVETSGVTTIVNCRTAKFVASVALRARRAKTYVPGVVNVFDSWPLLPFWLKPCSCLRS